MANNIVYRTCTYIRTIPSNVWSAITDPNKSSIYWGHANVSDWVKGSKWEHRRADGSGIVDVTGTVLDVDAPTRLVYDWASASDKQVHGPTRVTIGISEWEGIVRVTITHENLRDEAEKDAMAGSWAAVLANMKTYLEEGQPLPAAPWSMPK